MANLHGLERTATGALDVTERGGALANTAQFGGWNRTAAGSPYVVTDGTFQAGDEVKSGWRFSSDGALYVSTAAAQAMRNGVAIRTNGMLCVTVGAPANTARRVDVPTLGNLLVSAAGLVHVA